MSHMSAENNLRPPGKVSFLSLIHCDHKFGIIAQILLPRPLFLPECSAVQGASYYRTNTCGRNVRERERERESSRGWVRACVRCPRRWRAALERTFTQQCVMKVGWKKNSFLLGSSSLANHGGCLRLTFLCVPT
jgi:hypothetical protein